MEMVADSGLPCLGASGPKAWPDVRESQEGVAMALSRFWGSGGRLEAMGHRLAGGAQEGAGCSGHGHGSVAG